MREGLQNPPIHWQPPFLTMEIEKYHVINCNLTSFFLDHNYTIYIIHKSNNKPQDLHSSFGLIKVHFRRGINKIYNYLHVVSREEWKVLNNLLKYKQYSYNMGENRTLLSLASISYKPGLLPVFPFLLYM